MSEEQDRGAGLFDEQASRVSKRSEKNAVLRPGTTAERLAETFNQNAVLCRAGAAERSVETPEHDDLDADHDDEQLGAHGAAGLATHQDEAAADEHISERGEDRASAVAVRRVVDDVREVQ
jgi:hypothetical protein